MKPYFEYCEQSGIRNSTGQPVARGHDPRRADLAHLPFILMVRPETLVPCLSPVEPRRCGKWRAAARASPLHRQWGWRTTIELEFGVGWVCRRRVRGGLGWGLARQRVAEWPWAGLKGRSDRDSHGRGGDQTSGGSLHASPVRRPTSNTGVGDELINASGAFRRPAYLHGNGSPREHPRIKNSGWKKQRTAHQLKQI
jgi:hypothetical protein